MDTLEPPVTFRTLMRREIRNFLSNKAFAVFGGIGPVLFAVLMSMILWNGVMTEVPIVVWDADNSAQSRELTGMLEASPGLTIQYHVASQPEGIRLINTGQANAFFIIPENFAQDLLSGSGATVTGSYNNQFMTQGGTINKAFAEIVMTFAAKYDAVKYMSRGIPSAAVTGYVQPVAVQNHLLFNPAIDYSWFLLLGLVPAVWHIFGICIVIVMLGLDLKNQDAEIATFPKRGLLTGKLLPYLGLFIIQMLLIQFILFGIIHIPMRGSFLMLFLGTLLFITGTVSVGAMIISVVQRLSFSVSLASIYASPAFAYAGATFPYEAMPAAAKIWSNLLPITHYHRLLVDTAIRGAPVDVALPSLAALALFTFIAYPVALFAFHWRLANSFDPDNLSRQSPSLKREASGEQ